MPLLMNITGIQGESQVAGHVGWLPTLGFSWGGARVSRSMNTGSHRADTRVWTPQLRHATVRREADSRSAQLWLAMVQNLELPTVKFDWLRSGEGTPICYFSLTLRSVRILRIADASEGQRPIESIDLAYREIELGVRDVGNTLTGAQDIVTYKVPTHAGG